MASASSRKVLRVLCERHADVVSAAAKKDLEEAMRTFGVFPAVVDGKMRCVVFFGETPATFNVTDEYPGETPTFHFATLKDGHPSLDDAGNFVFERPPATVNEALLAIRAAFEKKPPLTNSAEKAFAEMIRAAARREISAEQLNRAWSSGIPGFPGFKGRDFMNRNTFEQRQKESKEEFRRNRFKNCKNTLAAMLRDGEVPKDIYDELLTLMESAS